MKQSLLSSFMKSPGLDSRFRGNDIGTTFYALRAIPSLFVILAKAGIPRISEMPLTEKLFRFGV